jgi:hypothetical protein
MGLGVSLITEIMDAMAAKIATAVTNTSFPVQVHGRYVPNPTPPCIDMLPGQPSRENELAGFGDLMGGLIFTVRARVTTADNEAGQDLLLALMDDEHAFSIAGALEEDQTLNGTAVSVDVNALTGFIPYTDAGSEGQLLGCEWLVTVVKATS